MFTKNVEGADRVLRIVVGIALLAAFFALPDSAYRYGALIGIVPLATGLMSTCPLYSVFGLNTCPLEKS